MDLDARLWEAAVAHVKACEEAAAAADEIDDPRDWPRSPANAPYDGCDTCIIRETLFGAWPVIAAELRALSRRSLWLGFTIGAVWTTFWFALGAVVVYLVVA
jgi:hypothetical protein